MRVPARDRHDRVICAECGRLVEQPPDRQIIKGAELANPSRVDVREELHVGGWRCEKHRYDVAMPITFYGDRPALPAGFAPVKLMYADRVPRWAVVRTDDRPRPWP